MKIAYFEIRLSRDEYYRLLDNQDKVYVAGYLMGRSSPKWEAEKEEEEKK